MPLSKRSLQLGTRPVISLNTTAVSAALTAVSSVVAITAAMQATTTVDILSVKHLNTAAASAALTTVTSAVPSQQLLWPPLYRLITTLVHLKHHFGKDARVKLP